MICTVFVSYFLRSTQPIALSPGYTSAFCVYGYFKCYLKKKTIFPPLVRYCYTCETHTPPRCSHCYDCKVCVLRRDHHCVFFGQCVGFANYRYFLTCLLFMWAGLLYAVVMNAEVFIVILKEGVTLHSFMLLMVPWIMLVTGKCIMTKCLGELAWLVLRYKDVSYVIG